MYAPAYAGAAVAEAKAKAKASMAKYLASLVKREEEGWTVLAAEVPQAPDERFFSSADELEQAPLIPAKRKAEDEPMEDAAPGVAQVPKALTRPAGALLELLNPPEEDVPMELLAKDEKELPMPSAAARLEEARLDAREDAKWQRRREMAKVKEQASSEEDENPAAPRRKGACSPRPSRSRRASTSSAMTRWRATSLASMRPRPLGSADCRPRTSSGSCEALRAPNSSRGAWSALWRPSTSPPGERPPLPGDKEEGQECRAFHPSAVKAFKIQTRLNATTIAQEEAKKADQVEAVERSAAEARRPCRR